MRLAGQIALGVGPSTEGFWQKLKTELRRGSHTVEVGVDPDTKRATAELAAWRKRQESNKINIPVRIDTRQFRTDLRRVEHTFKQSDLRKAVRIQVVVAGAAMLPALTQGAASATTALTQLGQAALVLPGIFSGLAVSLGTLATGLRGVGAALSASSKETRDASRDLASYQRAVRDVERAQRDMRRAVRDTRREIEDQAQAMRDTNLDKAQAQLDLLRAEQEVLRTNGKSWDQRIQDQIDHRRALSNLARVNRQSNRTIEDGTEALKDGIAQSDRYLDAMDRLSSAVESAAEAQKNLTGANSKFAKEMAKLSPAARDLVIHLKGLSRSWSDLEKTVSTALFDGVGQSITDLANKRLPLLKSGMKDVAQSWNTVVKSALDNLGSDSNAGRIQKIFGSVAAATEKAIPGINALVNSFVHLSEVGARFLPRLSVAFNTVMDRFEGFLQRADEDGSLERWIDKGLKLVASLGRSFGHIGSIFNSISEAYEQATGNMGGFASTMERGLGRLAEYLRSPKGRNSLVSHIQDAQKFLDQIKQALPGVIDAFQAFGEAARYFAERILPVFAAIGGAMQSHIEWVKRAIAAYLTFRTLKPIFNSLSKSWGRLTTAARRYGDRMEQIRNLESDAAKMRGLEAQRQRAYLQEETARRSKQRAEIIAARDMEVKAADQRRAALRRLEIADIRLAASRAARADLLGKLAAAEARLAKTPDGHRLHAANLKQVAIAQERVAAATQLVLDQDREFVRAQRGVVRANNAIKDSARDRAKVVDSANRANRDSWNAHRTATLNARNEIGRVNKAISDLTAGPLTRLKNSLTGGMGVTGLLRNLGGMIASVTGNLVGIGASVGATVAMMQWADANWKAGQRVEEHRKRVEGLKNQLDSLTGVVDEAAKTQVKRDAQNFQVTGKGNKQIPVNALEDADRLNITEDELANSIDPVQVDLQNKVQAAAEESIRRAVRGGQDSQWNMFGDQLREHGLTEEEYIKALRGDPGSIEEFERAAGEIRKKKTVLGIPPPDDAVPDLGTATEGLISRGVPGLAAGQFHSEGLTAARVHAEQTGRAVNKVRLKETQDNPFRGATDIVTDGRMVAVVMDNLTPEQVRGIAEKTGASYKRVNVNADGVGRYQFDMSSDLEKYFQGYAAGGPVWGRGTSTSDSIPALLSDGEFVLNAKAVKLFGHDTLQQMNNAPKRGLIPGFAPGGLVQKPWWGSTDTPGPFPLPPGQPSVPMKVENKPPAPNPLETLVPPGQDWPRPAPTVPRVTRGMTPDEARAQQTNRDYIWQGVTALFRWNQPTTNNSNKSAIGNAVQALGNTFLPGLVPPPGKAPAPRPLSGPGVGGAGGLTPFRTEPTPPAKQAPKPTPQQGPKPPAKPAGTPHMGSGTPPGATRTPHITGDGGKQPSSIGPGIPAPRLQVPNAQPGSVTYIPPGAPATGATLPNGAVYVPKLTGTGARPDQGATGASAVSGAPIHPDADILDYMRQVARAYGLYEGVSTVRPGEPNSQHAVARAIDLGGGDPSWSDPAAVEPFVQAWMADPTKVAATRQLIFAAPSGRKYGIINGRVLTDEETVATFGGSNPATLGGHNDHVHLALEGVPLTAFSADGSGAPITIGDSGSTITVPGPDGRAPTVAIGPDSTGQVPGTSPGGRLSDGVPEIPGWNAPIQGPWGDIPFLGEEIFQNIGKILLSAVLGFFGIDAGPIIGLIDNIIGGLPGNQGGGADTSGIMSDLGAYDRGEPLTTDPSLTSSSLLPTNPITAGPITNDSSTEEVAKYIVAKALSEGYTPEQAIAILSTALQESGLNPNAVSDVGPWRGIFQQDPSYLNREDPKEQVDEFFRRLRAKGGPQSKDIWKSIFWLQQAPGMSDAETAFNSGRQGYLTEIQSQLEKARELYQQIASGYARGGFVSGPGTATSDSIPALLSDGEFVMRKRAVDQWGKHNLAMMNRGQLPGFKDGGPVNPFDVLMGKGPGPSTQASPVPAPIADAAAGQRASQAAKVSESQQKLDAAQAAANAQAVAAYTGGAGTVRRDAVQSVGQPLFDARKELQSNTRLLEDLNAAAATRGHAPVPTPILPADIGVQGWSPEESGLERSSRMLSEGSLGLIPDFHRDYRTITNWGEASGEDKLTLGLDLAGFVPIPGIGAAGKGIGSAAKGAAPAKRAKKAPKKPPPPKTPPPPAVDGTAHALPELLEQQAAAREVLGSPVRLAKQNDNFMAQAQFHNLWASTHAFSGVKDEVRKGAINAIERGKPITPELLAAATDQVGSLMFRVNTRADKLSGKGLGSLSPLPKKFFTLDDRIAARVFGAHIATGMVNQAPSARKHWRGIKLTPADFEAMSVGQTLSMRPSSFSESQWAAENFAKGTHWWQTDAPEEFVPALMELLPGGLLQHLGGDGLTSELLTFGDFMLTEIVEAARNTPAILRLVHSGLLPTGPTPFRDGGLAKLGPVKDPWDRDPSLPGQPWTKWNPYNPVPFLISNYGATPGVVRNAEGGFISGPGTSTSDSIPALLSNGEFVLNSKAVKRWGTGNLELMNRGMLPRFNTGGAVQFPWLQPPPAPLPPAAPPPSPPMQPQPGVGTGPPPGPVDASGQPTEVNEQIVDPSSVVEGIANAIPPPGSIMGSSQPGAPGPADMTDDPRAQFQGPVQSTEHLHPSLKAGIEGAFNTIGSAAGTAIQMGMMAANITAPGVSAAAGPASSAAAAGAQLAGQAVSGAANVLASLLVGTVSPAATGQGYGAPLTRQPAEPSGVRNFQSVHNGDIVTNNLDEWNRAQQRNEAQRALPFLNRF